VCISSGSDVFVATSQAFFDLENGNQELKSDLKDLYINNAM
jgi:small subunit ribosomal protein S7e